ncbi:MAG TPA: branched-chain amino acid ABC transporter permease [Candidatus Scatomonas pullistercoris]|uniref:Branched-chain amino acid ABC transporter permease n=1 Tax=Candidatus Scatomonas pullistercoris TaxID=2840920 RepID=A0A9D1TAG9_9FIRM|nr:branched-chain amino acid ABC transporter permease [Candidatus Scatomonas pullistercoris]
MKRRMSKATVSSLSNYGLIIAIFIIVQICSAAGVLTNQIEGLLIPVCIYVIAAISLNLVVGISGELSLGHAGFMCVGAFSSALFSRLMEDALPTGPRFFIAIVIGALVAAFFGFLIGIPVLRLRGDYLAIVTLAFGEIIKNLLNIVYLGRDENGLHLARNAGGLQMSAEGDTIIKGAQGISGTPRDSSFLVGIILILVTLFIVQNIINSRTGRAIMAIRDNRIAAESIGINVTKYKLLAFTVSAALAGVAGALYSHNLSSLTVSRFDYNMSILILVYVVLGGIGSIKGSIIATVILYVLPEMLRFLQDYRMLIYAIVLIAMMLFNWSPASIAWRERIKEKFKRNKTKGVS